jgi:CBS domain-containing protein
MEEPAIKGRSDEDRERSAMHVNDIMTREVVFCRADMDIGRAARSMFEGRFGTLPVVDTHGKVTGIITDRDIAMAVATRQRNASHIMVHEAMSSHIRGCLATDDVSAALRLMADAAVRRLPVMDASGHLVGLLSVDDVLLRAVGREHGIDASAFVKALQEICSRQSVEPDVKFADDTSAG